MQAATISQVEKERRGVASLSLSLSTLIYGWLRTAYYRHIQLILPTVYFLPSLSLIVPFVRRLTLNHP